MDNNELALKIEKLIENETANNPDIQYLNKSHAKLIAQIISNYNLVPSNEENPQAEMIFLGAPTGAGKDTLVRKIISHNPEKNFVVLNMDMFRHYHNELSNDSESITDIDFALKTNQTSYEIYYIIQEVILREFPGTNVIVTGTMRDLDWVTNIIKRYKKDLRTKYSTSLATLAVPIKESAFSIFERYLNLVNTRENNSTPLRYTSLSYHNDTVSNFLSNMQTVEEANRNPISKLFDTIKVYRRAKNIFDLSEDTLLYDSSNHDSNSSASSCIRQTMYSSNSISSSRISRLLDIIGNNAEYLKNQNLYKSILTDLKSLLPQLDKSLEDISK